MKNNYFIIYTSIALFFLIPQFASTQTDFRLDSIQQFTWNDPIRPNDWLFQTRDHYTYAYGGIEYSNHLTLVKDNNTSMTWLNQVNETRTFNESNKLESDTFQYWTGSMFMNSVRFEYSYNVSGNNDVLISKNWDGNDWFITGRNLMTYNESNLVTEDTSQLYNLGTMMFDDYISQIRYTYSNDLLMQEDHYSWDNIILMDWKPTPDNRIIYNYNGSLVSVSTSQVDNGSGLEDSFRITYSYIGNNLDIYTTQTWNGSSWDDYNQANFTYNVNDLPEEIIIYTSTAPSTWLQQYKLNYYYSEASLGFASEKLFEGKAFPNPFHEELNISLKSSLESQGKLSLFDVNGKEISSIELNSGVKTIQLKYPSLSKGIYFINVSSESKNQTFKVIKH